MIITLQFVVLFLITLGTVGVTLIMDAANWTETSHQAKLFRNLLGLLIVALIIWQAILNFPLTLTLLVFCTGIIALIDLIFFYRRRKTKKKTEPLAVEYARSFFLVLLIVWVIRSFIIQPYRVPTGSLQPTVMPGDFILVNQFAYGIKFPVINNTLVKVGEPKIGDIALFYYPVYPGLVYIKRVIGVPGDHIVYKNKVLYINGKEAKQTVMGNAMDNEPAIEGNPEEHIPVQLRLEDLNGVKHEIFVVPNADTNLDRDFDITVPKGMYFMMGDNRDNSDDSRVWGFVPERNIIGKAMFIWLSWDPLNHTLRFNRIGKIGKDVQ